MVCTDTQAFKQRGGFILDTSWHPWIGSIMRPLEGLAQTWKARSQRLQCCCLSGHTILISPIFCASASFSALTADLYTGAKYGCSGGSDAFFPIPQGKIRWIQLGCPHPFQSVMGDGAMLYGCGNWCRVQRRAYMAWDHSKNIHHLYLGQQMVYPRL